VGHFGLTSRECARAGVQACVRTPASYSKKVSRKNSDMPPSDLQTPLIGVVLEK